MGAIGFGVGMRPASAPRFDPRALFAGGAPGGWWDAGDPATLFADAAGTIPAAVDGPVGRMADRSGRGNAVAQGAAASRPMLRRDANGRTHLAFDGADDWLGSAAAELRMLGPLTLAVAIRRAVGGAYDVWISAQTSAASMNPFELRTDPSGMAEFVASGPGPFQATPSGLTLPVGADRVLTAARTGAAIDFTVGAQAASGPHGTVPTSDAGCEFRLGARKGSPLFANGRLYAALAIGRLLTAAEARSLRAHMAASAGVAD